MAENTWVSLRLFHPSKWSYFTLLLTKFERPTLLCKRVFCRTNRSMEKKNMSMKNPRKKTAGDFWCLEKVPIILDNQTVAALRGY